MLNDLEVSELINKAIKSTFQPHDSKLWLPLLTLFLCLTGCSPSNTTPSASTPTIVIDQFGYLPQAKKIAVIRQAHTGYDSPQKHRIFTDYCLYDTAENKPIWCGKTTSWNNDSLDDTSGDKAWWLDFSHIELEGEYYIASQQGLQRSSNFLISTDVYRPVLTQALRTFYYQRAGFAKKPPYADPRWADDASHLKLNQDTQAKRFLDKSNLTTTKDLSGGWYDAGDYNKYTNWTADYIVMLLNAFRESPLVWQDNLNIPESGNGTPDILDEVLWGLQWLEKMQLDNGAMLSVMSLAEGSPPSSATGPSYYGDANTSATLTSSGAFALAANVFSRYPQHKAAAARLAQRAQKAWFWAQENPNIIFKNNDASNNSQGLAAGQQEVNDNARQTKKLAAAIYLFELTQANTYLQTIDDLYDKGELFSVNFLQPFAFYEYDTLIQYCKNSHAKAQHCQAIKKRFFFFIQKHNKRFTQQNTSDPYQAFIKDYTWGSNSTKARMGWLFSALSQWLEHPGLAANVNGYIHYHHGVNPLGLVYLSNMSEHGAEHSVSEFYHAWFNSKSPLWNKVTASTHGPAPGFVPGGPNPRYQPDACCLSSCDPIAATKQCQKLSPPLNQPKQKSYLEFNDSWPLNSWEVTENSNMYQTAYIRLLAQVMTQHINRR